MKEALEALDIAGHDFLVAIDMRFGGEEEPEHAAHMIGGERNTGASKWSFWQKIKVTIDTVVSFSAVPLRAVSFVGVAIAAISFIYAGYLTVDTFIYGRSVEGWTTIIVLILMIGGFQLFVLGMFGEYLWRVCDEVRGRPLFLVQELVGEFSRVRQIERENSVMD